MRKPLFERKSAIPVLAILSLTALSPLIVSAPGVRAQETEVSNLAQQGEVAGSVIEGAQSSAELIAQTDRAISELTRLRVMLGGGDGQGGLITVGVQHPSTKRMCYAAFDQVDFFQIHPGSKVQVHIDNGPEPREEELILVRFVARERFDKNTETGCKRLAPGERTTPANCGIGTIGGYWESRRPRAGE